MKKRERVLSACGLRNIHDSSPSNFISYSDSPAKNKQVPSQIPAQQLPPKPQNIYNQAYKLPPKPSPLIPNKQNNSYDYPPQSCRDNRVKSGSRQNPMQNNYQNQAQR